MMNAILCAVIGVPLLAAFAIILTERWRNEPS